MYLVGQGIFFNTPENLLVYVSRLDRSIFFHRIITYPIHPGRWRIFRDGGHGWLSPHNLWAHAYWIHGNLCAWPRSLSLGVSSVKFGTVVAKFGGNAPIKTDKPLTPNERVNNCLTLRHKFTKLRKNIIRRWNCNTAIVSFGAAWVASFSKFGMVATFGISRFHRAHGKRIGKCWFYSVELLKYLNF